MTDMSGTEATDDAPTYLERGDPAGRFADYYPAWVDKMAGDITLITFNADGQAQHIAAHYRPLSSLTLFSRLLREELAGAPDAELFLAGEA